MSLAAQKFIAGISHDSLQIYKQRRKQSLARLKDQGLKDQNATLFTEDLAEALQEVFHPPIVVTSPVCPGDVSRAFLNRVTADDV